MNKETVFNALSRLDEDLIDGSFPEKQPEKQPEIKKRPMILKLLPAAAAVLIVAVCILYTVYSYNADVTEYSAALNFFKENGLSTEGLGRDDIKAVYSDIASNSFTNSITPFVIQNSLFGLEIDGSMTSEEIQDLWVANFVPSQKKPYILSGVRYSGTPDFTLPEGGTLTDTGYVVYEDAGAYDAFAASLEGIGYARADNRNGGFFFKDDCAVVVSIGESGMAVYWYKASPDAPKNGLTEEEAKKLLCPENSLSKIDFHPLDVTPEGFYGRTGGQLFAVPVYSYDSLAGTDAFNEYNESYSCVVYYVKGSRVCYLGMETLAVFDANDDGRDEIFILNYGPTSGICTMTLTAITDKGTESGMFMADHGSFSFVESGGVVKICNTRQMSGEKVIYDIRIEDDGATGSLALYKNGEPVSLWSGYGNR